jgi:hypothetical protein
MKVEDTKIYMGYVIQLRRLFDRKYYFWVYRDGEVVKGTKPFESESDIPEELSIVTGMIYRGEI